MCLIGRAQLCLDYTQSQGSPDTHAARGSALTTEHADYVCYEQVHLERLKQATS